ncbi:MAG: T9SS type A sorting domain-containing protein, partial [Crocinitomicaceae bacterium]|nr:T9SS type A sorting domain-containing protein [Crocinitomicaceae bacterium]
EVLIYNCFGQLVQSEVTKSFTIENLPVGSYLILVKTEDQVFNDKFIKM